MVNLRSNVAIPPILRQLEGLQIALNELKSTPEGGPDSMEKDMADLCSDLSELYFCLKKDYAPTGYSTESADPDPRIVKEWRYVYHIADLLAKETWSSDGAKLQAHLVWTKVGFVKAKYHLNKLLISLGLEHYVKLARSGAFFSAGNEIGEHKLLTST